MAVVVEPILSEEKLRALLDEGHEQPSLDYKKTLDLRERRDVVELTKDVAAMLSEEAGGYIVIGSDDYGTVVPDLTTDLAKLFDEATLRGKLTKYLAEPLDIRSAQCIIDSKTVVLVYVGPHEHGWAVFKCDGTYFDKNGKEKVVFRVGDVFVRHGTASERWEPSDQPRLIAQITARLKDAWGAEIRQQLAAATNLGASVQKLQELPASALTWQMDAAGYEELVLELIRRGDDIPLRKMLGQASRDAAKLVEGDQEELRRLLDRLTSVAGLAVYYERAEWLDRSLDALVRIYELGFDQNGYDIGKPAVVWLWLDIVTRVFGLGGLAVRLKAWDAVRRLADRRPEGEPFSHYGSWLRHALTMASRAHIFETVEKSGLLARAHNAVRSLDTLHPDRPADDEAVLSSLCQFDCYGSLVVIGERGSLSSGNYYPSFAHYYSQRTRPAFVTMVTNLKVREKLFDGSDTLLADAIAELDRMAQKESFWLSGWDGIGDERVQQFVEQNGSLSNS